MAGVPSDMRGLLAHIGLTHIKSRGDEIWASCPSHHDRGNSWSINTRTGRHWCFACNHTGTVTTLVMEELGVDNFKAARLIRQYGGADVLDHLAEQDVVAERLEPAEVPEPFRPAPLSMSAKFATFDDVPGAALERRKLTEEAAKEYGLRWKAPDTWVLPIRSPGGQLMGWEEKSPNWVLDRPRGVNTSETVFGAERLRACAQAILVESPLDACRLWALGYEHAYASFGAVVSDDQMLLLSEYAEEICLALDNDSAGRENMARLITGVRYGKQGKVFKSVPWWDRQRITVINYHPSDGKDIGEMSEDRIAESLAEAVRANLWVQEVTRLNYDLYREAMKSVRRPVAGLPNRSSRAYAKSTKSTHSLRNGFRKSAKRRHTRS